MRTTLWTVALVAASLMAQATQNQYRIDTVILAAQASAGKRMEIQADQGEFHGYENAQDGAMIMSNVRSFLVGDVTLELSGTGVPLFNGQGTPPADSAVELLGAPRLVVLAGQEAQVRTATAPQYLVRRDDGLFSVETCGPDESPQVRLELSVLPLPSQEDMVDVDLTLSVAVMIGREEIPGVSLDVGRPILKVREAQSRVRVALGTMNLVSSQLVEPPDGGGEGELLVVLLRVRRLG